MHLKERMAPKHPLDWTRRSAPFASSGGWYHNKAARCSHINSVLRHNFWATLANGVFIKVGSRSLSHIPSTWSLSETDLKRRSIFHVLVYTFFNTSKYSGFELFFLNASLQAKSDNQSWQKVLYKFTHFFYRYKQKEKSSFHLKVKLGCEWCWTSGLLPRCCVQAAGWRCCGGRGTSDGPQYMGAVSGRVVFSYVPSWYPSWLRALLCYSSRNKLKLKRIFGSTKKLL